MLNIWHVVDKLTATAKKELFYIWPFGLAAYLAGTIFLDRTKANNAYKQLTSITDFMVKKNVRSPYLIPLHLDVQRQHIQLPIVLVHKSVTTMLYSVITVVSEVEVGKYLQVHLL